MIARYDLRDERVALAPKVRLVRGRPATRAPETITTIVIHQMAADFGVSVPQLRAARGDRSLALARRALGIACHAAAFGSGEVVLAAPLRWHVNHGNGYNACSVGLEIDGRHPGLDDDPSTAPVREDLRTTWGGEPSEWGAEQIEAAREALRWLVEQARAEGCPITRIVAHRQSSATRRSDPGQRIWRDVVLTFAVPELGLWTDPADAVGDGRPIPREWDPAGVGAY